MKHLITVTILSLLTLASGPVIAGTSTHALGFAFGSTYGMGLSYSRDGETWGFQISALPYWAPDEGGLVAGGINFKRNFHSTDKAGVYGSFGLAGFFLGDYDCHWDEERDEDVCSRDELDKSYMYSFGPGVGIEKYFWGNMLFRFELPLAIQNGTDGFAIRPIPNSAIMYRW